MKNPHERLYDSALALLQEIVESATYSERKKCQRPIEEIFINALTVFNLINYGAAPRFVSRGGGGDREWLIECQKQIGDFRVDFHITNPDCKSTIVVECDGHDFHERTKEQAAKDRSRDRYLTRDGYTVLRFTGSELWKDPWRCAEQIEEQFIAIHIRECPE